METELVVCQHRVKLNAGASIQGGGEFEIAAITAGGGNGWEFSETCLRESLPLWEGAQCFIDHQRQGHSVRDLAGVCRSPVWDAARRGVVVRLKAMGPSAGVLTELGRQLLAEPEPKPEVGFSADVLFTAQEKRVERILRVFSVDLVLQPARGGVFLRALNSAHASSCKELCAEVRPQVGEMKLQKEVGRMEETNPKPERVEATLEGEETRRMRQQVCACLLDSSLAASQLPAAAAQRVRKAFSGRNFEAAELQAAIEDARQLVSELTATAVVQGPGRIHGMFSSEDQLQAAVDDLFGAPRQPGLQSLRAARLSGIRELYLMLTGDDELHGGFHAERARLATTADFSGLVRNAMNKVIANRWEELGRAGYDWWQRVAAVEHFNSLHTITGTLVGTVGALPAVAEGEDYPELEVGDSPETASFTKYGGYIPLTLELIDRDETRKLRAYPRELASAGLRKISALVAAVFTENDGVGPTMADGGSLFNSTLVTSRGGHANLSTGALSAERWDAVSTAVYNQPMLVKPAEGHYGLGPKMAINPRYLLAPRSLQLPAMKILYPALENAASIYSENMQRGQPGDVVTVPEWNDPADWAAVCDPRVSPAIFVGERFGLMPEVFIAGDSLSPAVFTNDEHRLKVRHFLAVWVNDFRPLHKANVAGG